MRFLFLLLTCFFRYPCEQVGDTFYYTIDEVYEDHFSLYVFEEENDCVEIINSISNIFLNSYAFNEISKNPPQPYFDKNYYKAINIQERLESIDCAKPELNMYEFYTKIMEILSELKDMHIKLSFNDYDFNKFSLVSPFNYAIKFDDNSETYIYFDGCIDEIDYLSILEKKSEIQDFCNTHSDYLDFPIRIKSINGQDPFDYFLNLGKITATKNLHGTFSYIMQDTNYLTLDMISFNFTDESMKQLTIEFDDDDEDPTIIETEYIIQSDIDIHSEELNAANMAKNNRKRNINAKLLGYMENKSIKNKFYIETNKPKIRNRLNAKLGEYQVSWNFKYDEGDDDLFKCYVDSDLRVNVYYIHSFESLYTIKYLQTIKSCVEAFDQNNYPIIVINDLNNGGVVVLAQIFLGILSPLMPINKFKGRFRMTDNFIDKQEISEYIKTNFTNIYNCEEGVTYDYLIQGEKTTNYSNSEKLSEVFYLTNSSIQEEIENIRLSMKNKRKPTEILVLTDGYSFSAASLYIKYLQKQGGAVVVGYFGDIFDESAFDASQSPSPIFTHDILKLFNPEDIETLEQYGIEIEFAGIQSFYDLEETNVPLEYEVNQIDDRLDFFASYNGNDDNYLKIVKRALLILYNLDNNCYSNNKKIVKISENCDGEFGNKYTHGGYLCSDEGYWTEECVPSFCDMGYIFDEKNKICIKDICSSIKEDESEEENEEKEIIEESEDKLDEENEEDEEEKQIVEEENEDIIEEEKYEYENQEGEEKEDISEESKIEKEEENTEEKYEDKEKEREEEDIEEEKENEINKEKEEVEESEKEKKKEKENEKDEKEDGIKSWVIVIIVFGCIVLIVAIFLIIHYCRKQHINNEIDIDNNISKIELKNSTEVIT